MNKTHDHPNGDAPNSDKYLSLTEEEKDLELKKSIMRLHLLIYKIEHYDGREPAGTEERNDNSSL